MRSQLLKKLSLFRPRHLAQAVDQHPFECLRRWAERVGEREISDPSVPALCIQTLAVQLYELCGHFLSRADPPLVPAFAYHSHRFPPPGQFIPLILPQKVVFLVAELHLCR